MPLVDRSSLVPLVRVRADLVGATDRAPDSDITRELDRSAARLYSKLLALKGGGGTRQVSVTDNTYGGASVLLPTDFGRLLAVYAQLGGSWQRLDQVTSGERADAFNAPPATTATPGYFLTTNGVGETSLALSPSSTVPTPVLYVYEPTFVAFMAGGAAYYDFPGGWEDWIAWQTAAHFLAAEESDPGYCLAQAQAIEVDLLKLWPHRDDGGDETQADTSGRIDGYGASLPSTWGRW